VIIPVLALLNNDVDTDSQLTIKTLVGATFTDSTHQFVQIASPATNTDVHFTYTVTDGVNPESSAVDVTVTHTSTLTTTTQADFLISSGNTTWTPNADNGKDILVAGTSATNVLHGGNAEDLLFTNGNATNVLWGDNGNDTLVVRGTSANNELHGGSGQDTFAFMAGTATNNTTTISDFDTGNGGDTLDLSGLLASLSASAREGAVRFHYQNGQDHYLNNDSAAAINSDGNVAVQVNLNDGGGWKTLATMTDTGGNLSGNSEIINVMLNAGQTQQYHV
jgi:hypothetical protein